MLGAFACHFVTMCHRDRGAHVDASMHSRKRCERTQRITTNITHDQRFHAAQLTEHHTMRTSGAKRRRTTGQIFGCLLSSRKFTTECSLDDAYRQLTFRGNATRRSRNSNSRCTHCFGQIRRAFFHHIYRINALRKISKRLLRKRPRNTQFENGSIWQSLANVLIRSTRANDANFFRTREYLVV